VRGDWVNEVRSVDITYIRLQAGFVSLVPVIDWCGRYVLPWAVSITMDVPCCVEGLEHALSQGQPEIFNTDQGAQLTSQTFTTRLKARRDPDEYGWPRPGPG
jgi:putative transposase